jgi:hypothetical protein
MSPGLAARTAFAKYAVTKVRLFSLSRYSLSYRIDKDNIHSSDLKPPGGEIPPQVHFLDR